MYKSLHQITGDKPCQKSNDMDCHINCYIKFSVNFGIQFSVDSIVLWVNIIYSPNASHNFFFKPQPSLRYTLLVLFSTFHLVQALTYMYLAWGLLMGIWGGGGRK